MFSREDLECLDPGYFEIIYMDDRDVTIMSRNTRHMWYIHNPEYPLMGSCIIFHKHKVSHPYHQHGRSNTLRQAVRSIKKHDKWQLGGRIDIVWKGVIRNGSVFFMFGVSLKIIYYTN